MTRILITRHGQAEHNLNTAFFMGRSPAARLTEKGREQARRLGARLAAEGLRPRIVCSSLPRAVETAEIVASALGVEAPVQDEAFWELNKGDWEGKMPRDLPPEVKRLVDADPFGFRYPGGESYRAVLDRAAPAFERWVERWPDATILFVLHGDVIRALLYHLIGFPSFRIGDWITDPCALNEFQQEPGARRWVVRVNDASHLG